jgi:cytochrome P450
MTQTDNPRLHDLDQISLTAPELAIDPFPYFEALVEEGPVLWNKSMKAWLVSRYDDVSAALRDQTFGSDRVGPYLESRVPTEDRQRFEQMFDILARWMVFQGPPDHTRLRGLVHKSFTPRQVRLLQGKAETVSQGLADTVKRRLDAGETVDLMADYCMPFPSQMIAEMFGVPIEDGVRLKGWAEELGLFINGSLGDPERNERVATAMAEFEEYLMDLVHKYRRAPADNILSGLVQASDEADGTLSEIELIATCMLILDAGYKTVQNAMANAFLTLSATPSDWQRMGSDATVTGSAVEECLRFLGPGNVIVRRAAADIELGGELIEKGSRVYLLTGAANRDPRRFDDHRKFVIDRKPNPHLMFGQGIHFCLGAALARMELVAGLSALTRTVDCPELAVAKEDLRWHRVLILHGIEALPVRKAAS